MSSTENLFPTERLREILQAVEQRQRISVNEICTQFAISEATARRDLETLCSLGKIERVRGGAIALQQSPPERPLLQREVEQAGEKERIGRAAAELVQDGESIFLGSGTTVFEVARHLHVRKNLSVFTNSISIINLLADAPLDTLVCLGGMVRGSERSLIGHFTEQALAEIQVDKVFVSARAVSIERGLTNDYLPETITDRAILKAGREVILVADHTKFGRVSTVHLAPVSRVSVIVTDDATPPGLLRDFTDLNIRTIVV
jgi:DeoR family transcriptional regulator, aga operon transcriptional repressor